jgi:hypothetical protein
MQVEKFLFDNSLEKWLRYLGILVEKTESDEDEVIFLSDIEWVSQKNETIFGLCSGCWPSACCRRAAEYMMGNTDIANCSDPLIAANGPNLPVTQKFVTASFANNTMEYTSLQYNDAELTCNSTEINKAVSHLENTLKEDKTILIGVHYTNGTTTPPKNINRATRHYMVVVGMKRENNILSFRFYDPGRSQDNMSSATSESNYLTVEPDGCVTGNYYNRTYTLSEVLKTN